MTAPAEQPNGQNTPNATTSSDATGGEPAGGGLAARATPISADGTPAGQTGTGEESAKSTTTKTGADNAAADGAAAKPKRGRPKGSAKKTRSVELTLTVTGGVDGEWQADLRHGTERLVQGMPISAAAVSRAAKELHPEISGGIETVLDETRKQHRARLEALEAELNKVKQVLAELDEEAS